MAPVFAICDIETDYAIRFMEYLNRRTVPFEVQLFTEVEPLCSYGKQKHIELLLISERAMCEEIRSLDVGKLILLEEGQGNCPADLSSVYKYQPSPQVVREVLDCYSAERIAEKPAFWHLQQTEIWGIYSLADPVQQMVFALTMGQILAETRQVLYLNLQKRAGFAQLLEEPGGDLSDLLYFHRTSGTGLTFRLAGAVKRIGNLQYISSAAFPEDLGDLTQEEWMSFLQALGHAGNYEVLLLDFGDGIRGLPGLLHSCDRKILLSSSDPFSLQRRRCLEEEMGSGTTSVTWLSPPVSEEIRVGKGFVEGLPLSPLGTYFRRKNIV